ncbi:MAG: GldG family protein [Stenotrophobium sp.]
MTKKQTLIQQLLSGGLFIAVLIMLGWLSTRYKTEVDWTAGHRNSISAASMKLLKSMPDPVKFIAFIPSGDADIRNGLQFDIERYKRDKKNITLEFVDPSAQPKQARDLNVTAPGEVVVEYQGRHETLSATTEPVITGALQRLAYSGEQWVVFLEGEGERSISSDTDQTALTKFAGALRDKGLKVQALNLVKSPRIPDNTSVLVLASPSSRLLPGEVKMIQDYVDNGGNLLWLADPDYPTGADALANDLGVAWQNGYAIFPDYQLIGTGNPGFYAATDYPPNPVTQGLDQVTLFPLVRSLVADKTSKSGWQAQPLLKTNEMSWLATGDISKGVTGKKPGDIAGPLNIGMTLTREYKDPKDAAAKPKPQRVALIGDSDFLSNGFLGQLGNQQLGINLIQWLASRDAQLNIDIPKAPDTSLYLPGWAVIAIGGGFVLLLPLLLIGGGVTRWVIRRRK